MQTLEKRIVMALRYVQCSCFDRIKWDTSLVSTLFVFQTFLFKIKKYLIFADWPTFDFWPLFLQIIYTFLQQFTPGAILNSNISGNKPYRALKMKMPKGKFVKTQYLKGHYDIFYTSWFTGLQTLEKNNLKSAVSPFLNGHHWHIMQQRLLKSTDFTNRPANLCVK